MALASVAIISFATPNLFNFEERPLTYMLYLIYFRWPRQHETINWSVFDINETILYSTYLTGAVIRTLIFSITYLALNFLLLIFVFRAIGEMREKISIKI